jgi:hypothetical protein
MKAAIFLLIAVLLIQCNTEEKISKSTVWEIDFSDSNTAAFAQGTIEKQNLEAKVVYVVSEGALRQVEENLYSIDIIFDNGESLKLVVAKKTSDYNFHFPASDAENQLVSAVFNGVALDLSESAITIQPEQGDNKLNIVTNIHTVGSGDFNGTLTRIPLLQ